MDENSKAERSRVMSRIRSKDTGIELILRRALFASGLRYRVYYGKEKIDIAFPKENLAVFTDGCFWHLCPMHGHIPKSNVGYWEKKLLRNVERAKAKDFRLEEGGWAVLHFWEHQVVEDIGRCVSEIRKQLERASIMN